MLYEEKEVYKINKQFKPVHIALTDVSAGYDIQSFKLVNDKIVKVFIEVKAVSHLDFKFYLSALEYATAMQHKEEYYIYLLPVDHSKSSGFDIKKLIIINNIHNNIFKNNLWHSQSDGYLINKI